MRAQGHFLLVGGGALPKDIGREFIRLAGGKEAHIVVIPSASRRATPQSAAGRWRPYGVRVQVLHARNPTEAAGASLYKCLDRATGVWIGGGDQGRLAQIFAGTVLRNKLKAVLARDGVIGGTSAGASIVTGVMVRGRGEARGFGLLDRCVIDQHFTERGRYARLKRIIDKHPQKIGFGIDQSTALVISGTHFRLLGRGTVTRYAHGQRTLLQSEGRLLP
jgi:cyanophycinase